MIDRKVRQFSIVQGFPMHFYCIENVFSPALDKVIEMWSFSHGLLKGENLEESLCTISNL